MSDLYRHQELGVQELIKINDPDRGRIWPNCFYLADETGAGKSKQVIEAAQRLFRDDVIDDVIVVAPAAARSMVWYDTDVGQLIQHLWDDMRARVIEFHGKGRAWTIGPNSGREMLWKLTNYEYVRNPWNVEDLRPTERTLLILDESASVKSHKAKQTRGCNMLRKLCGRIWLLNGTPIAHSPMDLYSQFAIMDPRILDCKTFFHFRARYAKMGGWQQKQIVGFRNLEDLQARIAPYILRRMKRDCLDLPEKLPPEILPVSLSTHTWEMYRDMRDELVAWLSESTAATASQAGARVIRLAQITSGFVGGVINVENEEEESDRFKVVGSEKLDALKDRFVEHFENDSKAKILVWCRFRRELERIYDEISSWSICKGKIYGGQSRSDRQDAVHLLDPTTAPDEPVVVIGIAKAGGSGLNLAATHHVIYSSNDTSLFSRLQSEDRVHRPGQTRNVSYTDIVATGPSGQKTVDHVILRGLRKKEDLATWTCAAWISALTEE